jgi:hypothetical protein
MESIAPPALIPGERYAGLLLRDGGEPAAHLILLPGEPGPVSWSQAMTWAAAAGGNLPSRREAALLFCNLRASFAEDYYWSGDEHATAPVTAWGADFATGAQTVSEKHGALRARAVRRVPITPAVDDTETPTPPAAVATRKRT